MHGRSCVRKKSRKPIDPLVLKAWDYEQNKGVNPLDLPSTDDSRQYLFWCDCQQHRVLLFLGTLAKEGKKRLICKVCTGASTSEFERILWTDCDRISKEKCPLVWVVEARVLLGTWAAANVYFHEYHLVVMIDGYGESECCTQKQRATKKRHENWNACALLQGFNVLRIHHKDVPYAEFVLMEAMGRCEEGAASLMYSPSYSEAWRMASRDLPDEHAVVDLGDL